jgi:Protein of unknown function (DUF1553)
MPRLLALTLLLTPPAAVRADETFFETKVRPLLAGRCFKCHGPDTNTSAESRTASTVPLQALHLTNNPWVREQAAGLARRMVAAADESKRVAFGWEVAWNRPPTAAEVESARNHLDRYRRELARLGVPESEREPQAFASLARTLLCANEFIYVD